MKTRILLIGRMNEELMQLHQELAAYKTLHVELVTNSGSAIDKIRSTLVDLVVFNLDSFSETKIRLATDLRDLGFTFPVLVLAEDVSPAVYQQMAKQEGMVILEKPFDWKIAQGLIRKFSMGDEVNQQAARRYRTDQLASVETIRRESVIRSRIKNLSSTGAFFEFLDGTLQVGDILKLNIPLQDLNVNRTVTAQVVWAAGRNAMTGVSAVGVRFIGGGDIYQMMTQGS